MGQRLVIVLIWAACACKAASHYELDGRLAPDSSATVSLFGATTPFHDQCLADSRGRFRFRELTPGQYTVVALIPGRGETRRTVDVGPGTADRAGRVSIVVNVDDTELPSQEAIEQGAKVSARELSIPERARHEYFEAQKKLSRREVDAAVAHLEQAVKIAPQFSAAWNNLGTIAYQTHEYARAENDFRQALRQNRDSFEPLVNLGGVLLNEGKLEEALAYNRYAVRSRPKDALANSQLGLSYYEAGNLDLALKYLEIAKRIDPAHFSYPQLTLAKIHLRRDERAAAAAELRDFLRRHPDAPQAAGVRDMLTKLTD